MLYRKVYFPSDQDLWIKNLFHSIQRCIYAENKWKQMEKMINNLKTCSLYTSKDLLDLLLFTTVNVLFSYSSGIDASAQTSSHEMTIPNDVSETLMDLK